MKLIRSATAGELHLGLTIVRVVTGIIFMAHGWQKLFVLGIDVIAGGFGQAGIPLASLAAPLVSLAELFGGLALVAGFFTRVAAAGLSVVMLGAMMFVHLSRGFFLPNGIEFTLMLLGATVSLAITGAGSFSLDALFARRVRRPTDPAQVERIQRVA